MTELITTIKRNQILLAILFIIAGQSLSAQNTYYSYKDIHLWNGDWHHEYTWTLAEDGEDITTPAVSLQAGDSLVITENTTVVLNNNIDISNLIINIRKGGQLVLNDNEFENGLAGLHGNGELFIAKNYYPQISGIHAFGTENGGNTYIEINADLGTVEFTNNLTQTNNLTITHNGNNDLTLQLKKDLNVFNDFTILNNNPSQTDLNFQLNGESQATNLSVSGDLTIEKGVNLVINENNRIHHITLNGNLTANGNIDLTNSPQYQQANNGAAIVTFTGAQNNTVNGSGNTLDIYRMIIDKGSDQTFMLDFQHSKLKLFYETGLSNQGSDPNPVIRKAIWIKNGTLRLREGIQIEELSSGGNDFFIPLNGALWIDGATIYTTRNRTNNTAITILGALRITAGVLDTRTSAGIIYRGTSNILIEGGYLRATQVRPSNSSNDHQLSWTQTGGVADIDGENGQNSSHPRFSLPLRTQAFSMSGGVLKVKKPINNNRGLVIGVSESNQNITGGTIELHIPANTTFGLSSTVPFFNLEVFGTNNSQLLITDIDHKTGNNQGHKLTVINDLTLHENATFNANGFDLELGGDFTIKENGAYLTGGNTTAFVYYNNDFGDKTTTLDIHKDYTFTTHNTIINKVRNSNPKVGGVSISKNGRQDGETGWIVEGKLEHYGKKSYIHFNDLHFHLKGDVMAEKISRWDPQFWTNTVVFLNGSVKQNISMQNVRHDMNPLLHFVFDNPAGFESKDDFNAKTIEWISGIFNIGSFTFFTEKPMEDTFGVDKMILTNGLPGDGGYEVKLRGLTVEPSNPIVFPVGVEGKYTPAYMAPTLSEYITPKSNTIRINPVNQKHPAVSGDVLQYNWKMNAQLHEQGNMENMEFDFVFHYDENDVEGNENQYRAATINNTTNSWELTQTVDRQNNEILFEAIKIENADFTAGKNSQFQGNGHLAPVFTSLKSGEWTDESTWEKSGGGPEKYPQQGSIVVINYGHVITVSSDSQMAESVKIKEGVRINNENIPDGVLDLGTTSNHIFESFSGKGKLRLASPNLPKNSANTYDNLHVFHFNNGGEIEFYGNSFTLPSDFQTFHNLTICGNGRGGEIITITLSGGNTLVTGEFTIKQYPVVSTNPDQDGTLTVEGRFHFQGRDKNGNHNKFLFAGNSTWEVHAMGELRFWEAARFAVEENATPTNHKLYAHGNLSYGRGGANLYGDGSVTVDLIIKSNDNFDFGRGQYGGDWKLNKLIVDFQDESHKLTIKRRVEFPSTTENNPLELRNGKVIFTKRSDDHLYQKDVVVARNGSDFHIPQTATLIIEGENTIRTLDNSNIQLDGNLIVRESGKVLLGYENAENEAPQASSNCDMVYGTGNNANLEVHGNAKVFLTGQFRRNLTTENGVVTYAQTGNSIFVAGTGQPNQNTRGIFEVLNNGSNFSMSAGATLILANSASDQFPALFIEPTTGFNNGTIVLGNENTRAGTHFQLRSKLYMGTLKTGNTNMPAVSINTYDALISGNLVIGNGATFQTNGFDVELAGNLINNGSYNSYGSETLTMNGYTQSIEGTGATILNNLFIDAGNGINIQHSLECSGNLTVRSGFLNDNGNQITIAGNLNIFGQHNSNENQGGILMNGSEAQTITGQGAIGRITIDTEIPVEVLSNITITNTLNLNNGIINLGQNDLILKANSTIHTTAEFNVNCMIQTAGNLGDGGIRKTFSTNEITGGDFLFPFGTDGNYTPVEIKNLTSFPAEKWIRIYPVSSHHPTVAEGIEGSDPNRVLQYYWGVETNFTSDDQFAGNMEFNFKQDMANGNINNYFTAQLRPMENESWSKVDAGITTGDNMISFNHTQGVNNSILTGFYTAGEANAIPDNVIKYTAVSSGNWENANIWSDNNNVPPTGVIIEIPENHTVRITENMKRVYKSIIEGHLIIDSGTTFHNLGFVEGNGTIEVQGTGNGNPINLPNGRYENFNNINNNGTIVFSGNGGKLPSYLTTYNNLTIKGTGNKQMSLSDVINIRGNLNITESANLITTDNQTIRISGNLNMDASANLISYQNKSTFVMNGQAPQTITGNFTNGSGSKNQHNAIYRLKVQNPTTVSVMGEGMEITNRLYLDNGILVNRNSSILISSYDAQAIANYSRTSYIEGALQRNLPAHSNQNFVFPVSHNSKPRFIAARPTNSTAGKWTAEFFDQGLTDNNMSPASFDTPLVKVIENEYWALDAPADGNAYVSLYWGPETGIDLAPANLATLLVAQWDEVNQVWESKGNTGFEIIGNGQGILTSDLGSTDRQYFTFGSSSELNPLPIELINFSAHTEENRVKLQWQTATELNNDFFTIERSTNGKDFYPVAIVQSMAENGTSSNIIDYTVFDSNPVTGTSYYRLKQTDFDGSFEYFDPVAVNFSQIQYMNNSFTLYPNPVTGGEFNIVLQDADAFEKVSIKIFDLSGKQILASEKMTDNSGNLIMNMTTGSKLNSGIYMVVIASTSKRYTEKLVIR